MALLSKDSGGGGSFEPVPAGTYTARCVSVVDLGVQETPWGGKEKVYFGFEVPSVRVEWDDKEGLHHTGPALIGSRYTNSIHPESNLGKHLITWRGKAFTEEEREGFDLFNVLNAPCLLSVVHNHKDNKIYANINGIMRLPQGMVAPNAETELLAYSPADPTKITNFDKLPEWLQKLSLAGQDTADQPVTHPANVPSGAAPPDDFLDDIPFAFILPTAVGFILAAQSLVPLV